MHRLGMPVEHGHPHGRRVDPYFRVFEDLLRFPDHLHLFARVAIVLEGIDVRDAVERNLLGRSL